MKNEEDKQKQLQEWLDRVHYGSCCSDENDPQEEISSCKDQVPAENLQNSESCDQEDLIHHHPD